MVAIATSKREVLHEQRDLVTITKSTNMSTIVALGTAVSECGAISIIRMSGDRALEIAAKIFESKNLDWNNIVARQMYLGTINAKNFKDRAFCVYYKAPKSYTGEDIVEFQAHGGVHLAKGLLRLLIEEGARPAEAGEFTKRAFLNGKLSLMEAEGVADIINAESEAGIMQAYRMIKGELSDGITECERLLLSADANLEAVLDYPDELTEDMREPTLEILKKALSKLKNLLEKSKNRKYINDGATVAIGGLTNVGKSSLLNALLNDERAIVTDIAGTTRDTLHETIEINGVKLNIVDTAGIREGKDLVERVGIERAKTAIEGADLVLFIKDLSMPESKEVKRLLEVFSHKKMIIVGNKGDIAKYNHKTDIIIEAKNGKNIQGLVDLIIERLDIENTTKGAILSRERHIFAVKEAIEALESAVESYYQTTIDCTIVDIKAAYRAVASITGSDVEESIVDKIFQEFCVGK